jgi:SulP family sulfate permease
MSMIINQLKKGAPSLPILETLRDYDGEKFRGDAVAGFTVALISVPQCMAYALIAGVDPIHGLYAAMIGAFVGSLFGSSHHLNTGPAAVVALFVGSVIIQLNQYSAPVILVSLSVIVGLFQILFCVLQLGDLARFVSVSVMSGFLSGSGVVIIGDQLPTILGLEINETSPYFFERLTAFIGQLYVTENFNELAISVGVGTILIVLLIRAISDRWPAILISVGVMTGLSYFYGLGNRGIDIVGTIPSGIPAPMLPPGEISFYSQIFGGALALNLLASVQALSISKSLASQTLQDTDDNQELFGQGMANILCGFFRGIPVTGSLTRSFLNFNLGAKTQVSGLIAGAIIGLAITFLSPIIYYIPMPVLAGVIIVVGFDIFDWEQIYISLMTTRRDLIAFSSTFLFVILLELDIAIFAGVITSIILYLRKAAHVDMKEYVVDEQGQLKHIDDVDKRLHPKVALIDISGETFFGSADLIKGRIKELCDASPEIKVVILRMKNAMNLDITSALMLEEIANGLSEEGRTLMLSGATPHVQNILEESGVADHIGRDKILVAQKSLLDSTRQALERADAHIDDVLEGEETRDEEEPPLRFTMRKKRRSSEDDRDMEEPIEKEKSGHLDEYDERS